ncbi:MAG: response regulator [Dehalococcoidia bacterium]
MSRVVLIVEDDARSMRVTQSLLHAVGYTTVEATDGEQGVELARARKPDVILMDIVMPRMDGYSACRAIKADRATRDIPVIMFTSPDFELNKELGRGVGACGYITKPLALMDDVFDLEKLESGRLEQQPSNARPGGILE